MNDSLEALLHRCHREDVIPLAERLGVRDAGLGLGQLAKAVARALRQAASHPLSDAVLRAGQGMAYADILKSLAGKLELTSSSPEATEIAILQRWFFKEWRTLSLEERETRWSTLGLSLPLPTDTSAAISTVNQALGPRLGFALSNAWLATHRQALPKPGMAALGTAGCLFPTLLGPFVPILAWWMLRPNTESIIPLILEVARLRQVVLHRVTVGVVGSPSTGKDAAIKTLFGIDTGNVSPIAGSTKEVTIQRLEGSTALFVVNTPGMGDVLEQVTEEAKQVLDHIDVYLYLINAEGGVQARELADYRRCRDTGKPVLAIVNKIDVLRPADKEAFLLDAQLKLGCPSSDFAAVAFDPLPQLSPGPINVQAIQTWLERNLEQLGKLREELPWCRTPTLEEEFESDDWTPIATLAQELTIHWPQTDLYGQVTLLLSGCTTRVSAVDGMITGEWAGELPEEMAVSLRRRLAALAKLIPVGPPEDPVEIQLRADQQSISKTFSQRQLRSTSEGAGLLDGALAAIELTTFGELSL